ncbi:Que F, NADPH-dependent 7-cyano-7-deazaguanine reductase [Cellulophaga phage phi47:1]|uniref:GTP cyclohydrolase n=1 Tax=Cellulophaga phage phiSM TaxID=756280 RepID=UPI0002B78CE8|nr:GTP cyclohydrolase [Cellulophaga phage phiSM]AGF91616.1 GTP cyclohydrolase I [Cellulophaga phage phi47:1]AGO47785.1 Que F, NADPH-dependent 7-cyano-7-deazaguanine reductase [Cellulophaga phage phi3ST:2]AGO49293.1 Que F, NADPH-dependent 7-cyano-7-deazaguanine reductase [Cellulophaga phage phi38:2]AGO49373.1 Que F, NADPH-dependent 7-cyano-7-deazaguanine reductase [Cellulophaga phage phi3:1]AGH07803.1 7-cyano-7-deazaguanine reductase [Cellulophaga phage phiSM]
MDPAVNQEASGKVFAFDGVEKIMTQELKTFDFDSSEQLIETFTPEFSAVCPFSGLPDIAELTIVYRPRGGKCIELKSLKYYLTSFRNVGLYQEGCTKTIYQDLAKILETDAIIVKTKYNVRGGFSTTCQEGKL